MGKSCFQALKRVMCKREPWEGTERWWRLYMSLFCQIPISLGSSCYRPNSRGPLLLPTPFLLPQRGPNRLFFGDREQSRQSSQVAGLRLSSFVQSDVLPGQHSSARLGRRLGARAPRLQSRTIFSAGNPRLLFLTAVSPLRNSASSHSLLRSFSRRDDTSSDQSRVRHGGHCATGVLHGYAPEI